MPDLQTNADVQALLRAKAPGLPSTLWKHAVPLTALDRSGLSAGSSGQVWGAVRDSVWRTRVLNRRWESVVRQHVARPGFIPRDRPPVAIVGATPGMEVVAVDTERAPCVLGLDKDRQGEAIALTDDGFFTLSEGVGEPVRFYRFE